MVVRNQTISQWNDHWSHDARRNELLYRQYVIALLAYKGHHLPLLLVRHSVVVKISQPRNSAWIKEVHYDAADNMVIDIIRSVSFEE